MEGADELCQDAQKLHNYQRNNSRQLQQIEAYKAKRVSCVVLTLRFTLFVLSSVLLDEIYSTF